MPDFESKLETYYQEAEGDENRVFDPSCKEALKQYQADLSEGRPEAVKMCDSWGEPYRYLGNPGEIQVCEIKNTKTLAFLNI